MGDCAARGADLFESIAAEIISAMILGGTMAQRCKIEGKYCVCVCVYFHIVVCFCGYLRINWLTHSPFVYADPSGFILFPLVVHSFDLVISSVGILSIRGTRDSGSKSPIEDPMAILQKGYSVTIVLAVLTFGLVIFHLQLEHVHCTFKLYIKRN